MPDFHELITGLKSQVADLAKDTVGDFAGELIEDTHNFVDESKERLIKYARQFKAGEIDADMLADLLEGQVILGKMELLLQKGLAKIKADTFTAGLKKLLVQTVTTIAGKML